MIDSIEDNFTFNVNAPPSLELARCLQFTQAIQDELDSISNATAQNNPILCGMKTVLDALDRCDITSRALSGTLDQVDRQDMTTEIAHLKETVAAVDSECARHVSGFEDYKGRVRTLNTSVPWTSLTDKSTSQTTRLVDARRMSTKATQQTRSISDRHPG